MSKQEQVITVHVVAYRKAEGLHVQAAVTPELLDLTAVPGGVTIQWTLDTKGFRFPTDGSAIVITSPGAKKSFGPVSVSKDGRTASVRNKNSDGLAFAYNVSVVEEKTGLTAVLDPIIQNRSV
jgi:hypothetical protein